MTTFPPQKSDDADYNKFIDSLSNRRRQIADANPKSLAPSVLSHSASGSSLASNSSAGYAPTKSIIIGGGQPIVIPGQTNITNDPKIRQQMIGQHHVAATIPQPVAHPIAAAPAKPAATGFMASLFGAKTEVQEALPVAQLSRLSITEHKVISVDEFCPDGGGGLDRSFLDDEPSQTSGSSKPIGGGDESDTDDDTGNPMVARFHDEPSEVDSTSPVHQLKKSQPPVSAEAKVNPLAKVRSKTGAKPPDANPSIRLDYYETRKSSLSSDDIEVPTVLASNDGPPDNFDSWLSSDEMSSRRRSPEGGEDVSPTGGAPPEPITLNAIDDEKVYTKSNYYK